MVHDSGLPESAAGTVPADHELLARFVRLFALQQLPQAAAERRLVAYALFGAWRACQERGAAVTAATRVLRALPQPRSIPRSEKE